MMTVEHLAGLGQKRTISPLFERTWTAQGRSNPVAFAMQIVENRRRARNRRSLSFATFSITCCFAVVLFLLYQEDFKATTIWYVLQEAFILGVLLAISIAFEEKGKEVGSDGVFVVDDFCARLNQVVEWMVSRKPDFCLIQDESKIIKIGTDILVVAAHNVLGIEKAEKEATEQSSKEHLQESAGNARAEFTRRYNTLQMIGMASGGHEKYFAMAKKLSERESATTTPA